MKTTIIVLVTVMVLSLLLRAVDNVVFPNGFSLALSIVQLVLSIQVLDRLGSEDTSSRT